MKFSLTWAKQYWLPVAPAVLVTLVLQCVPAVVVAQADDSAPAASTTATAATTTTTDSASTEEGFSIEQQEQLVAPIALYPDALLLQILMAATYPLEIVEASRWISGQPDLTGDALDEALLEKDWDPSIKSLTALPKVLNQMSEDLDWTQDLGDAFLAQESELLDTVQHMRDKAYEAGNLETTEQQTVVRQEDKIIVIESTSPEVIYVPTYSPTVVYGPAWHYPYWYYPRFYYPPRPGYGFVAFGAGVVVGAAIWGGCRWGWGRSSVNININRHNTFNRNTNVNFNGNRAAGNGSWKHNPSHRKGVNYGNSGVAQKYGASSGSNRVTREQARGHGSASAGNRASGAQSRNRGVSSPQARPSTADRARGANTNSRSPSTSDRSRSQSTANRNRSTSRSAYSGSRSPSTSRQSSFRGASSRGTRSYGGSRGGRGGGRRR